MRAIIHDRYGPVDLLTSGEIERPSIGDRDVLVRVHAAGLNVGDLFTVLGSPFVVRLSTGLRRPKAAVPGMDLAGRGSWSTALRAASGRSRCRSPAPWVPR